MKGVRMRVPGRTCLLGLMLVLSITSAQAYQFGSKVVAGDGDVGIYLEDFPLGKGPVITWWDCGTAQGSFDDEDVLYLDTEPLGTVSANDVRLTPYGSYSVGSKVTAKDNDVGKTLFAADCPVVYANLFGGPGYDFEDPIYIKTQAPQSPPGPLGTNDVRLMAIKGLTAGSRVHDSDLDFGKPTATLYDPPYASPAAGPAATIRFFNANGNLQDNNLFSLYDRPDTVYLDISNVPDTASIMAGWNTPNNVRMSV
jgi:hypothetical protein